MVVWGFGVECLNWVFGVWVFCFGGFGLCGGGLFWVFGVGALYINININNLG